VAHSLSAKKRIRQNERQAARNRWRKRQIKESVRGFEEAIHEGDKDGAGEWLQVVYKNLDRVAAKGLIHKNTAARKKSRLAKQLDAMP
jgi:small subunit ribosomal protein S20